MTRKSTVFGKELPEPRLTPLGAALVALAVALPAGFLIWLAEWLFT